MNFDAAALAYVRYVLEEKNLKPGALASKAGISASTLTRALNDPNHKFKLSMTTLQKISDYSGINPAPFLEAKDAAELTTGIIHRQDLYRESDPDEYLNRYGTRLTLIVGDIAAGVWKEPSPINLFDYGPLSLTSTFHEPKDCFGCIVRDNSATMIAEEGDVLFCVRIDDKRLEGIESIGLEKFGNKHGLGTGPVIVERRSKDEFKIELTVRFIKRRQDGTWDLVSASREDHFDPADSKRPKIQKINLPKYTGTDEYKIIGTVEWVVRGDTTDATSWIMFDMS